MSLLTGDYPSFAKFESGDPSRVYDMGTYLAGTPTPESPRFSKTPGLFSDAWSFNQDF
jgi:hypothetical protein